MTAIFISHRRHVSHACSAPRAAASPRWHEPASSPGSRKNPPSGSRYRRSGPSRSRSTSWLRRLYERYGRDGRLTLDEYESLGRLEGAVREEAQRIIAETNPTSEELKALHAAFVPTMVRINAQGDYARRRIPLCCHPG